MRQDVAPTLYVQGHFQTVPTGPASGTHRHARPAGEGAGGPLHDPADPGPALVDAIAERELREIYDACVEELEGDQREVVLLREFAGASWEEAARELRRDNVHAAQELYRRARIRLADIVQRRIGVRTGR